MIFDNAKYLSLLIKRVYQALILVIIVLLCFAGFFAKKWYDASKLENVYVVFPDKTYVGTRAEESLVRSEYEMVAFTKLFLEKAFAHNEYSLEENLKEVTDLMDKESARLFISKMDETVESLYKDRNAISTVVLEEIEINKQTHPHEVLVYYNTALHFVTTGQTLYEDIAVPGGLYFQVAILERSYKNPYGMQIRKLKFLQPKSDDKAKE
jgi:hypothetical protein